MFRKTLAFLPVLALALGLQVSMTAAAKDASAKPFAHEISDLKADPAIKYGRLPNGVRYALMRNEKPQGRASLRFAITAGSFNEKDDQQGLAHFLEHLAFNGSTHFPPGTLVEYFQRLGMSFGGDTNASTNFDRTIYQLELPDTKPETLAQAFTLFSDYGGGLLMNPDSIEKERGIILAERRDRDSRGIRQWKVQMDFLYPDTILTKRLPIGTEEVIQTAKRDRFVDFYNTWYRPEKMIVVAVGDFDVAKVEAQLTKALSGLKARAPARPDPVVGKVKALTDKQAKFHHDAEASEVTVSILTIEPHGHEVDNLHSRTVDLPLLFAHSMINQRFSVLAKAEGSPITGGGVGVSDSYDIMRTGSVGAKCRDSDKWQACMATAEQELRRALEYGFQEQELREVIANMRNGLEQGTRMAGTRSSGGLASGLVDTIIDEQVFTAPAADEAMLKPVLDKITVDQCLQALRKLWAPAGRRIFVAGEIQLNDKEIVAAYDASREQKVTPPEAKKEQQFAYTEFGKPGKVAKRTRIEDMDITQIEFENGVRLNLKRTDFDAGRIAISARIGGGLLTAPVDKPGLPALMSSTYIAGGLGKHSIDDLRSIFAGKNLGYGFAAGGDAFGLSGGTTPENLLLQMQVLTAFLLDPGYRPEALRQFQKGVEQTYVGLAHSINAPWQLEIPKLLANGDPRFGLPSDKSVLLSRNYDEVRAWLKPELSTGAIEIAIVGDLDVEKTIEAVAQTFGALPKREAKPAYTAQRKVSMIKQPVTKQYVTETELPQGLVDVRWPATDSRSDVKLSRRINLLASVFSDRLRVKLREQMGQAYSPSVQDQLSDVFTGYGYIAASASVDPGHAQEVADAIRAVAGDLYKNGVTKDELDRAREPLMTGLRSSLRQNGYWMGLLSGLQEIPEKLQWAREREADYASIKPEELSAVAKQFLEPSRSSLFISLPKAPAKTAVSDGAKPAAPAPAEQRRTGS